MRYFILAFLSIFFGSFTSSSEESQQVVTPENAQPNIIIIYADDLGFDALKVAGIVRVGIDLHFEDGFTTLVDGSLLGKLDIGRR